MVVNSYLELHTTLISWMLYESLYAVLVETGMVLLPILWMLISQSLESLGRPAQSDSHETTVNLLRSTLGALVVLAMCLVPVYTVNPTDIHYQPRIDSRGIQPATVTARTVTEQLVEHYPSTATTAVQMPVWWAMLHALSAGITQTVIATIPDHEDLRQAKQVLHSRNLQDPGLANEYVSFINTCYHPARNNYIRLRQQGLIPPVPEGIEPDWPGSPYLQSLPGGYLPCPEDTACRGGPQYLTLDILGSLPEHAGLSVNMTCADWWRSIHQRVLNQARADQGFVRSGWNVLQRLWNTQEAVENAVVRATLENFRRDRSPISTHHETHGQSLNPFTLPGELLTNAISTAGLGAGWGLLEVALDVLSQAMPVLLAIMLLFAVVMIPLALLMTGYRMAGVLRLSFVVFGLIFLHALLTLAEWLDHLLTMSLFGDQGAAGIKAWLGFGDSLVGHAQKRMVINIVLILNYILMPMIWGYLMQAAGVKAGQAVGHLGAGAGIASQVQSTSMTVAQSAQGKTLSAGTGRLAGAATQFKF